MARSEPDKANPVLARTCSLLRILFSERSPLRNYALGQVRMRPREA